MSFEAFDVYEATISDIHEAIVARRTTCVQVVQGYLDRIEAYDKQGPMINAVIAVNPTALDQARAFDDAFARTGMIPGPLAGIPIVLKDNIETTEMPTTAGSLSFDGYLPAQDSTVVARLRAVGAIILAKVNLDEFSRGSSGTSGKGGQTRNPYDTDHIPGGSSAGVGAAIAAGFATAGIGTETGVSIRNPTTNGSLVGVAPTRGLVPTAGIIPISFTQDRAGPIARTAADAARVLAAIVGYDPRDPQSALSFRRVRDDYTSGTMSADRLHGARIGVARELFGTGGAEAESGKIVDIAIEDLRRLGAEIIDEIPLQKWLDVRLPVLDPIYPGEDRTLATVLSDARTNGWEQRAAMNMYLNASGAAAPYTDIDALIDSGTVMASTHAGFLRTRELDLDRPEYAERILRMSAVQSTVLNTMAQLRLDAIVYPMKTQPAWPIGGEADPDATIAGSGNVLSSIPGLPAVVVPAGYTTNGLPVNIEFLGSPFSEPELLGFAHHYQSATNRRHPPASTPSLQLARI
jgi:Asp-tRNA(Asn)/Glu-tRNA(Gln) amidotransferase A subunit family amidase